MASSFVFKPIIYEGKIYIDGGVLDLIPVKYVKYPDNCIGVITRTKRYTSRLNIASYTALILKSIARELSYEKSKELKDSIVYVDIPDIKKNIIDFSISSYEIRELLQCGERSLYNYTYNSMKRGKLK